MDDKFDYLCKSAKDSLYDKRPFVTKKKKWSFHCLNCEKKFSSDDDSITHYYVWNYLEFGDPISNYSHLMLCSVNCVHESLNKIKFDVARWNSNLEENEKYWEKKMAEEKKQEIREKEAAFIKNYKGKRNYFN